MIGAAAGLVAGAFFTGCCDLAVAFAEGSHLFSALAIGGLSMEACAIASALTSNRGMGITVTQPASYRQIVYVSRQVGGTMIYASTTGGKHDQYHMVIVLAGHQ